MVMGVAVLHAAIRLARMIRAVEGKAPGIEISPAPLQHLFVDVDADVLPRESFGLEPIVTQRMRVPAAAATDIHDGRVQPAQSRMEGVHPEVFRPGYENHLVGADPVSHADSNPHMIRRNS